MKQDGRECKDAGMNNAEKQTYAKSELTRALVALLETKELSEITVSELSREAQVSRVSFYRNFAGMEDVLEQRARQLLGGWYEANRVWLREDEARTGRNDLLLAELFGHMRDNSDFYLLLHRRGLLRLVVSSLREILMPDEPATNFEAYLKAFAVHGMYGWIDEWMSRGMAESAEEMEALLRARTIG